MHGRRAPVATTTLVVLLVIGGCTSGEDDASPAATTSTTVVAPRSIELAIDGEGFLLLRRGTEHLFARAATFTLDEAGKLATDGGDLLQGWPATEDGTVDVNGPVGDLVIAAGFAVDARG